MDAIPELVTGWHEANAWWQMEPDQAKEAGEMVVALMDRKGYHGLSHLKRMFQRLSDWQVGAGTSLVNARLPGWIFAHDLVYQPGAEANELRSIESMNEILARFEAKRRLDQDDQVAILSTTNHRPVDASTLEDKTLTDWIALFQDLDLEILAARPEEYDEYRDGVYEEYLSAAPEPSHFPALWRTGRGAFLQSMLDRDHIFKTQFFRDFEDLARRNLARELRGLADG